MESALIYPLSLLLGLFVPVIGWVLAWLLGLGVFYFERNRNVRRHGLQSAFVFGTLSVVLAVVGFLKLVLGGIFVIGGMIAFGLGLLSLVDLLGDDYSSCLLDSYGLYEAGLSPALHQPFD